MDNVKRDTECEYRDICEEMYGNDENFKCLGINDCEHWNAYLEGKCVALEW